MFRSYLAFCFNVDGLCMSFAHSSIGSLILFLLVSRRLLITNAKPIVSTPLAFLKKDFLFF